MKDYQIEFASTATDIQEMSGNLKALAHLCSRYGLEPLFLDKWSISIRHGFSLLRVSIGLTTKDYFITLPYETFLGTEVRNTRTIGDFGMVYGMVQDWLDTLVIDSI